MKPIIAWHKKHQDKLRIIRTTLGGIALLVSLILVWSGHPNALPFDLAWIAVVLCGLPIVIGALIGLIKDHDVTADVLVSLALIGCLSLQEYDAAGEVAFIMEIGTILENFTSGQAQKGIESLIRLSPQKAWVQKDNDFSEIPVEQVKIGDLLRVLPGEEVPIDGVVVEGYSSLDESALTGESLPLEKKKGDPLYSGTLNLSSRLLYRATSLAKDSAFQRIVALAKEQESGKAKIIRKADRWAAWMVLVSFLTALITCLAYYFATKDFLLGFRRGVTVLVVFCPCAFVLATPTAVMAGIGNLTKHRILVRSGEALERIGECDLVCFDKTGTLTLGEAQVTAYELLDPSKDSEALLKIAVAMEKSSSHPFANAIVKYGHDFGDSLEDLVTIPGKGIEGKKNGVLYFLGRNEGGYCPQEERYFKEGSSLVELSENGKPVAFFALNDTLKKDAKEAIDKLKAMGITSALLTGDHPESAKKAASSLGITEVRASLLPNDKKEAISAFQQEGHKCLMGGDGINDALALKESHASFSMGLKGKQIAIEASDAVFVKDEIGEVPYLLDMAKRTLRKIKINIWISMGLNAIAVSLSIAGLLNPVSGAIFHNAGSVAVVLNSLLLLFHKEKK